MNSKIRIVSFDLPRFRSPILLIALMLAAIALLLAGTTLAQTDNSPDVAVASLGIADEKPTEGPFVEVDGKFMVPYTHQIPGTEVTFRMIPIAGGVFKMGSTDDDALADVTPVIEVTVKPFWIGEHEVNWAQYQQYMALDAAFKKLHRNKLRKVTTAEDVDAVYCAFGLIRT